MITVIYTGAPLYKQIYTQVKEEILLGSFKAGSKIPSKRKLANQLQISINTIDTAYSQLISEGYIESIPKKGYYVCNINEIIALNIQKPSILADVNDAKKVKIDFSPSNVDFDSFPFNLWRKHLKNTFDEYNEDLLKSPLAQGEISLRQSLSSYLYQARGVICTPDQIVIGAGTNDLLQILGFVFSKGVTIAMENPVYHKAYKVFSRAGQKLIPIDVDEKGISVKSLENKNVDIVHVTPSHQFPLGISMPINRRIDLLNWANEMAGRYIIEDDYDSEFRYDAKPLPSLQAMDKNQVVIYMGTFSKSISSSLRISYMVLPEELIKVYKDEFSDLGSATSKFEQLVLNSFMENGDFERHLNKMRKIYKQKRELLVRKLLDLGSSIEIIGENAGHHLLVKLDGAMNEQEMCASALEHGIMVYGISKYFIGSTPEKYNSCILLGYGSLHVAEIENGVSILSKAWNLS